MPNGVTTKYLDPAANVYELLGNGEAGTVRIAIELVAAIIAQSIPGPNLTTQAELLADLNWDEPTLGAVWGDANTALNGVYKKSGAAGAGTWSRIGDLPMSVATAAALVAKAPLVSPDLTGVPTAPTPAPGTNNDQLATTAFIKTALDALIENAPGTLDTLNELASALNDDPDFAATMTTALAAKAPLDAPSFTGNVKVPTAAAGTNSTTAASTAFVQAAVSILADVVASKAPLASPNLTGAPTAPTPAPDAPGGRIATMQSIAEAEARAAAQIVSNRRWAMALTGGDPARTPFGIDWQAQMIFRGVDVSDMLTQSALDRMARLELTNDRSGYALTLRDPAGRVGFGITKKARMILAGKDVTEALDGTLADRVAALEANNVRDLSILCAGDSLTEGAGASSLATTYPAQVAALTGRQVTKLAWGGQNTEQIAARIGASVSLLTVTGDEIPASGSVDITSASVNIGYYAGEVVTIPGTLAGVPGVYRRETVSGGASTEESETFTRDTAGTAVRCLPDTPFIPTNPVPGGILMLWVGRNDYSGVTDPAELAAINERILDAIQEVFDDRIAARPNEAPRIILYGVTSRDSPDEYVGTANYAAKRDLWAAMASRWPRSAIDLDAILRASGDGSATDNADIANGVLPTSLTAADRIHLNDAGYGIAATVGVDRITENETNDTWV